MRTINSPPFWDPSAANERLADGGALIEGATASVEQAARASERNAKPEIRRFLIRRFIGYPNVKKAAATGEQRSSAINLFAQEAAKRRANMCVGLLGVKRQIVAFENAKFRARAPLHFTMAQDASLDVSPPRRGVTPLDPALLTLRSELERLDYVVVPHGDHICVRLPLISSVRIRHNGDRFRFTPQFGPFPRTGGLLFTSAVSAAAVAGSAFAFGLEPATLVVGFLGVIALAHDACRFIVTEGCLTRLQQLIALRAPTQRTITRDAP